MAKTPVTNFRLTEHDRDIINEILFKHPYLRGMSGAIRFALEQSRVGTVCANCGRALNQVISREGTPLGVYNCPVCGKGHGDVVIRK